MSKDLINSLSTLDRIASLWNPFDRSEELHSAHGSRDGYWCLVEGVWGYRIPSKTQQNGSLYAWTLWLCSDMHVKHGPIQTTCKRISQHDAWGSSYALIALSVFQ